MSIQPSQEMIREITKVTGMGIEELRDMSIDRHRSKVEAKLMQRIKFVSHFPFIGRGSVMHDELVDHDMVEAAVTEVLR